MKRAGEERRRSRKKKKKKRNRMSIDWDIYIDRRGVNRERNPRLVRCQKEEMMVSSGVVAVVAESNDGALLKRSASAAAKCHTTTVGIQSVSLFIFIHI